MGMVCPSLLFDKPLRLHDTFSTTRMMRMRTTAVAAERITGHIHEESGMESSTECASAALMSDCTVSMAAVDAVTRGIVVVLWLAATLAMETIFLLALLLTSREVVVVVVEVVIVVVVMVTIAVIELVVEVIVVVVSVVVEVVKLGAEVDVEALVGATVSTVVVVVGVVVLARVEEVVALVVVVDVVSIEVEVVVVTGGVL